MGAPGDFLKREHAGLPMWGWIGLGVAALFLVSMLRRQGSNGATPGAPAPGPPGIPPAQGKTTPYIFMVPQNSLAQPDAGNRTLRFPDEPRVPGRGPTGTNMSAYGFEWSPYTVLGIKQGWRSVADTSPAGIAHHAYGLKRDDDRNSSYFATLITENNPNIDWSKPLPVGTSVYVPKINYLPDGAEPTQFNQNSPGR